LAKKKEPIWIARELSRCSARIPTAKALGKLGLQDVDKALEKIRN
jgi:hypothetical protein